MDVLLKFANEQAALTVGEQFGLYVDQSDEQGNVKKDRKHANYRRGPSGEKLHTVASEVGEHNGKPHWWVLIRTNVDFGNALDAFIEWRSDSGAPYPDDPDIPKINFL